MSSQLTTTYATSFSTAADIVVGKLRRMSDARLRKESATWLRLDSTRNPGAALAQIVGSASQPLHPMTPLWLEVQ
ncbi:hypothetical protein [Streptomyces sp. NPDC021212]|uniref:hypothetical protein n=1 Tax=Streptomyces sp. NPDC021212 TaxID=3365118 RepID=UPI0037A4EA66